jgi:polar amino acid transport system ATP-binding protein
MLRIKNINLTKKQNRILNDISLECPPGMITTLIGKSGAGKTSLLKCIGQLDRTYSGTIEFETQDLRNYDNKAKAELIGFVFQQYNLFPHMTILENCSNPLKIVKQMDKESAEKIAHEMLEKFGLKNLADAYPVNLSGGQQQRVAIVRTLCFNPRIICLDEPSSALDPENTALLVTTLKDLANNGIMIILSSQDMLFVKSVTSTIAMIENGQLVEKCDIKNLNQSPRINGFMI